MAFARGGRLGLERGQRVGAEAGEGVLAGRDVDLEGAGYCSTLRSYMVSYMAMSATICAWARSSFSTTSSTCGATFW